MIADRFLDELYTVDVPAWNPSYNHWSMRRTRPFIWQVRRFLKVVRRRLPYPQFITFFLGVLSALILGRINVVFSEHDLAVIDIFATQRTISDFGSLQVLRNGTVVEQYRFRDGNHGSLDLRLIPGVYDIRIRVLTRQYSVVRKRFERASHSSYTDVNIAPVTFFSDDEFVQIPGGRFRRGSNEFPTASPPHEVTLHTFSIRSIPVTTCEYATYLAAGRNVGADVDEIAACSEKEGLKPAIYMTSLVSG